MKFIFTIVCLSMISTAFAAEISCTRDDEADDWFISGKLGGATVELFDNDTNATFKLKGVLESLPPIYVYEEVGAPTNVIRVKPSRNKKAAKAEYYSKDDSTDKILFSCSVE